MRKSEGVFFEEWLGLIARSELWNGRMRTPDGWRILFNLNYTVEDAAACNLSSLQLSRKKILSQQRGLIL